MMTMSKAVTLTGNSTVDDTVVAGVVSLLTSVAGIPEVEDERK